MIDNPHPQPEKCKHNANYPGCVFIPGKQKVYTQKGNEVKNNLEWEDRLIVVFKYV